MMIPLSRRPDLHKQQSTRELLPIDSFRRQKLSGTKSVLPPVSFYLMLGQLSSGVSPPQPAYPRAPELWFVLLRKGPY